MKANDFILVHDANINQVYEIPQEEIKAFIKEKYKGVDLEKDYDAIVFMTGSQTVENKLTKVPMQYGDTKFTIDLTDEQLAQVKEILQTNSNKTEFLGLVKISIALDNLEIKTDAQTMKLIMQKLDTPIAQSVLKETKEMYTDSVDSRIFGGIVVIMWIFVILIILTVMQVINSDIVDKYAKLLIVLPVIMAIVYLYFCIFIRKQI